jgi:SAM-dependent methyltransferase
MHPDGGQTPLSQDDDSYEAGPDREEPRFWSSPAYIAATAQLFGVGTAPVELSRILEIGCAAGNNIIPMAARHPHASFVGIDSSPRRIAAAKRHASEVGLNNIDFHVYDITSTTPHQFGSFDYLIAHGVYSWLAPEQRPALWQFCMNVLSANGLIYLSYNTLPYWHLKRPIRDAITFHAQHQPESAELIHESIGFARDVAEYAQGVYGDLLREEVGYILEQNENYFSHDDFEVHHHPVYVKDLLDEAEAFGFRYISEATATYSSLRLLHRKVAEAVERFGAADRSLREQYIDFYTGRAFRRSLFAKTTHARKVPLDIIPEKIDNLHIVFADLPPSINFAEPTRSLYYFDDTYFDAPPDPETNPMRVFAETAIARMAQTLPSQPRSIAVQEIYIMFATMIQSDPDALDTVRAAILEFFYQRKVAFSAAPLTWEFDPLRPCGQRLVVSDAAHGRSSTVSVLHDEIYLRGENVRQLLALLDGQRTRQEIIAELLFLVQTNKIEFIFEDDQKLTTEELLLTISQFLDEMLMKFSGLRILTK